MKQKDFMIILVPLFVLTILWVIFNIYHSFVTSTIKDPLSIQIIPIEGKFDTGTVNEVKNRKKVNPLYEIQAEISEAPILVEEPESTESSELITEELEESE